MAIRVRQTQESRSLGHDRRWPPDHWRRLWPVRWLWRLLRQRSSTVARSCWHTVSSCSDCVLLHQFPPRVTTLAHQTRHAQRRYLQSSSTAWSARRRPFLLAERDAIVASFEAQAGKAPFSYRELLSSGKTKTFHRIAIGFFTQAAQQLSGINMVSTYANKILVDSFDLAPGLSHLIACLWRSRVRPLLASIRSAD